MYQNFLTTPCTCANICGNSKDAKVMNISASFSKFPAIFVYEAWVLREEVKENRISARIR